MFDFLDDQPLSQGITDPEVVYIMHPTLGNWSNGSHRLIY